MGGSRHLLRRGCRPWHQPPASLVPAGGDHRRAGEFMKTRRITDRAEFDALAPVWAAVAAESGQTSPFHSHDWFASCWNVATPDRQPEVIVVEDAGGPMGLVPLVRWKGDLHGAPARFVGLLHV